MKLLKYLIVLFSLLFIQIAEGQQDESVKIYGVKRQVITLSNGKYEEFHDLNRYERIGTVIIDIESLEIVKFLDEDSLALNSIPEPEVASRWMSIDPLAAKNPDVSPYAFVKNNPIIYVDADGRDNVIYLVYLPSKDNKLTKGDAEKIRDQANKNFESMGLKTQVVLVDAGNKTQKYFDPCKIDGSDAVAVLGTKQMTLDYIYTNDQIQGEILQKDWGGGAYHPEESENNFQRYAGGGGKYIAIDANGVEGFGKMAGINDKIKTGALLINHGAGHNASEGHAYDGTGKGNSVIMSSARDLEIYLKNPGSVYPQYDDIVNNDPSPTKPSVNRNQDYVDAVIDRFGTNEPKANALPK